MALLTKTLLLPTHCIFSTSQPTCYIRYRYVTEMTNVTLWFKDYPYYLASKSDTIKSLYFHMEAAKIPSQVYKSQIFLQFKIGRINYRLLHYHILHSWLYSVYRQYIQQAVVCGRAMIRMVCRFELGCCAS